MIAFLLTLAAAALGAVLLLVWCKFKRKPATVATCGDPSCEACALLSGKWPKYNPGPREREGMSLRRGMKQQLARTLEFEEARRA